MSRTNNAPPVPLYHTIENRFSLDVDKAVDALKEDELEGTSNALATQIVSKIFDPRPLQFQIGPETEGESRDGGALLVYSLTTEKGDQQEFERYWREQNVQGSNWALDRKGNLRATVVAHDANQLKADELRLRKVATGVVDSYNKEFLTAQERLIQSAERRIRSRQKKATAEDKIDAVFAAAGIKKKSN